MKNLKLFLSGLVFIFLITAVAFAFSEEHPKKFDAVVTRVIDADTMVVDVDLWFGLMQKSKVRLFGIDTYESRTRDLKEKQLGVAAKGFVKDKVEGKQIHLEIVGRGKFGRPLGYVFYEEDGVMKNINEQLIDMDLAVEYRGGNKNKVWLASGLPSKYNDWGNDG